MEFSYNGKTIFLDKEDDENLDIFIYRGYFIIKNINKANLSDLIKLSYIYVYNKYCNCIYNKTLMNELEKLI